MIERIPRMILSTQGLTSAGKTHFALSGSPRPALLLDFDYGAEGLPVEVLGGVDIRQYDLLAGAFKGESDASRDQLIKSETERFLADFREAIDGGKYRTIVTDTASVLWSGLRLRYGKNYAAAEEVMHSLIRAAYKSTVNLTLIHHMSTIWKRNSEGKSYKAHGVYERTGMENVDNKVQLAIQQRWVEPNAALGVVGHFEATVLKCRDRKELEGETVEGADWQTLCTLAVPGVDWSK
jgi:hypothetical protein